MLDRLRQSLAFRLAAVYAAVFALGATALFAALYWMLGRSLLERAQEVVRSEAHAFAQAYTQGGPSALRERLADMRSPDVRTSFLWIIDPDGTVSFANIPQEWIDPHVQARVLAPAGWGSWQLLEVRSARLPTADALRDFAVASIALPGGRLLTVGRSTESRTALLAPLRRAFELVGAAALFLSLGAGTWLGWRATRPLREVASTARRIIEQDDLAARVRAPRGSGELAALVRQFNRLLDKNAAHVRVLRETLDNLAHDLRTPLTRLRGTAEVALLDTSAEAPRAEAPSTQLRGALADCIDESDRVLHLLEALLDVSAAEAGMLPLRRDAVDLRSVCERAADLYREVAEERHIGIALEGAEPVPLRADPVRLGQAVSNLVDNALKYTPAGGRVTLAAYRESGAGGPSFGVITVTDTGPGVPPAEREAIWRRLYRGDASRSQRGLGLGLTLVRAIVEAHGGTATIEDGPGGGARFILRIPC